MLNLSSFLTTVLVSNSFIHEKHNLNNYQFLIVTSSTSENSVYKMLKTYSQSLIYQIQKSLKPNEEVHLHSLT